jgi:hypothetical protein
VRLEHIFSAKHSSSNKTVHKSRAELTTVNGYYYSGDSLGEWIFKRKGK